MGLALSMFYLCNLQSKIIFLKSSHKFRNTIRWNVVSSTSYTSGAYAGNPNVFIRLNSGLSGSYATIASCHKPPLTPSPYATSYVTTNGSTHHVYCKPASTRCSSRVSYYASSPLIQVPQVTFLSLSYCHTSGSVEAKVTLFFTQWQLCLILYIDCSWWSLLALQSRWFGTNGVFGWKLFHHYALWITRYLECGKHPKIPFVS